MRGTRHASELPIPAEFLARPTEHGELGQEEEHVKEFLNEWEDTLRTALALSLDRDALADTWIQADRLRTLPPEGAESSRYVACEEFPASESVCA